MIKDETKIPDSGENGSRILSEAEISWVSFLFYITCKLLAGMQNGTILLENHLALTVVPGGPSPGCAGDSTSY